MSCIEIKTKKYKTRSSPPYHANDCKDKTKLGNNGKLWKSVPNKKLIYKWVPLDSKLTKTKMDSKKEVSKKVDNIHGKTYYIHDNGGRPFKVICNEDNKKNKTAFIFKDTRDWSNSDEDIPDEPIYGKLILEYKYKKLFNGSPLPSIFTNNKFGYSFESGNSILLYLGNSKYIYIGSEIYSFTTGKGADEEIIKYCSPIGNSDVPYPFAVSNNKTYLMIEDVILDNQKLNDVRKECNKEFADDPYFLYYEFCNKNTLKLDSQKLKKTILQKRL